MIGAFRCPVCGREDYRHPLSAYWCPFCGGGDNMKLKIQLNKLSHKVEIIENLLEWRPVIGDLDDYDSP